jgi:hypothetical protein
MPDMFSAASARHGMVTMEDRRDYICNALVTKRVRKSDPNNEDEPPQERQERRKSDLYITGVDATSDTKNAIPSVTTSDDVAPRAKADDDEGDEEEGGRKAQPKDDQEENDEEHAEDSGEACSICLNEYVEGDEICWSRNRSCNHVFHRECILEVRCEIISLASSKGLWNLSTNYGLFVLLCFIILQWLLRHDDCPCCRHNFLNTDDTIANPVDDQSWGNTNLFWSPLRIPPLPRIDADEEEFWNRIHEFRHFARRYLNGPYQPNTYGASNSITDYPPPYLTRATRPYPSSGPSIFQLEDPSPAYSLAIGRSTNRLSSFEGDLEIPSATATTSSGAAGVATASSTAMDLNLNRTSTAGASRTELEDASSVASSRSSNEHRQTEPASDDDHAMAAIRISDTSGTDSEERDVDMEHSLETARGEVALNENARNANVEETSQLAAAGVSLNEASTVDDLSSNEPSSENVVTVDTEISRSPRAAESASSPSSTEHEMDV